VEGVSAVDAMAAALSREPVDTAWLVATGALTNVALLARKRPDVVRGLRGLSTMAGAVGAGFTDANMGRVRQLQTPAGQQPDGDVEVTGNWSRWAEFNVLADPEAAAAVFSDPCLAPKTTMVPLDVTHLVLVNPGVLG